MPRYKAYLKRSIDQIGEIVLDANNYEDATGQVGQLEPNDPGIKWRNDAYGVEDFDHEATVIMEEEE